MISLGSAASNVLITFGCNPPRGGSTITTSGVKCCRNLLLWKRKSRQRRCFSWR